MDERAGTTTLGGAAGASLEAGPWTLAVDRWRYLGKVPTCLGLVITQARRGQAQRDRRGEVLFLPAQPRSLEVYMPLRGNWDLVRAHRPRCGRTGDGRRIGACPGPRTGNKQAVSVSVSVPVSMSTSMSMSASAEWRCLRQALSGRGRCGMKHGADTDARGRREAAGAGRSKGRMGSGDQQGKRARGQGRKEGRQEGRHAGKAGKTPMAAGGVRSQSLAQRAVGGRCYRRSGRDPYPYGYRS